VILGYCVKQNLMGYLLFQRIAGKFRLGSYSDHYTCSQELSQFGRNSWIDSTIKQHAVYAIAIFAPMGFFDEI